MHIFVDIRHLTHSQKSGVGEYTLCLLHALFAIDSQHSYTLFSTGLTFPSLGQIETAIDHSRIKHLHLPVPNKWFNLRQFLLQHPALNWHCRDPVDLLFLPNLNFAILPNAIPTILTVHDLSWKILPECFSKKRQLWHKAVRAKALIQTATRLIVPSHSTKHDLMEQFQSDDSRIQVIPLAARGNFQPKQCAEDHGVRSRLKLPKRFVLFVGTLEPRKNIVTLLESVQRYRTEYRDDIELILSGGWGWNSTPLRQQLAKRDFKGWVHVLGYIKDEDRPALYRSASVFVWPSLYEGFGLPVLEAMSSGVPVITSHTSSLAELTNGAALLIDPYENRGLAVALRAVLCSTSLQQRLRNKGLEQASRFSWEKTARDTLTVFKKFCG